jgi:hypothetical protein
MIDPIKEKKRKEKGLLPLFHFIVSVTPSSQSNTLRLLKTKLVLMTQKRYCVG